MTRAVAVFALFATALPAHAGGISDRDALAIVQRHCVMCHAAKPAHESFQEAPNGIVLESIADMKKHATAIYAQTVQSRAMPLGNQTGMTDDERVALGHWLKELP